MSKKFFQLWMILCALSVFVLPIGPQAAQLHAAAQWVQSKEHGFKAKFPGQAQHLSLKKKSFFYSVSHEKFFYKDKIGEWVVDCAYLPDMANVFAGPQSILEKAKNEFLKNARAQEKRFQVISYAGAEARELVFHKKNGKLGKVRFYLQGRRLFTVVADIPNEAAQKRFFTSFQIRSAMKSK